MLAQKIIGFHEPLPRKGTETLVSDWLFILLYVSTNHYPARGLKRQPRSFCPSLPGFHEPLPRKGTETFNQLDAKTKKQEVSTNHYPARGLKH